MKIDLTCPIELRSYELIYDDRGYARAYITFNNLSPHAIDRFDAIACWANSQSGQNIAQPFRADMLSADARSAFRFSLSTTAVPDADTLEIHFTRVRFADGEAEWIGGQSEMVDIEEIPAENGRALHMLTAAAGEDAVRFPIAHPEHWICVCGRANFRHETVCSRCLRSRREVFTLFTREAVLLPTPAEAGKAADSGASRPRKRAEARDAELRAKFQLFRRQREILVRRTITMGVIVLMLMVTGLVCNYRAQVNEARRGAIPPTQAVDNNHP